MFTPIQRERVRLVAAGVLAAALGACAMLAQGSCAATPAQQAKAAKAEHDLCRLRLVAASIEGLDPELQPPAGSVRAQLEAAEDKFCAQLLAAGGEGGAP